MVHTAPARDPLIDALRGFALFGILAVNIQTFSTGLTGASLGVLDAASSTADRFAVATTAFFLQYKFYPIFCFCFGYGFAVQTRRWRAQGRDAAQRFKRRTDFLLRLGVAHGVLLWFGDILTSYALAGKVLASHIGKGPKKLLPVLRFWLLLTLGVAIPVTILLTADLGGGSALIPDDPSTSRQVQAQTIATYTQGSTLDALGQRVGDYLTVTVGFLLTGAEIIFIMLVGAWCAHAGVLRQAGRHAAFWRKVLKVSLAVGLPLNAWFALAHWQHAHEPWVARSLWQAFPDGLVSVLAAALVAGLALQRGGRAVQGFVAVFAPAGRYALTHYVGQSLAMFLMLGGSGLGWGATLRQAELLSIALAVFLVQLLASHVMVQRGIEGPLEAWWRRHTHDSH
ncbi:MAG: DUF418 domain-containing protein [Betaproteobacteria bacterium]|nr:DUF418 domain-containing protein [Betaproteobacteria bacterium]